LRAVRVAPPTRSAASGPNPARAFDRYDIPLRELEYATFTFDLLMDQGAYAEFKRHRMMTQTPQRLVAERVAEAISRVHPLLSRFMRLPAETPAEVAERHFTSSGSSDH
jgi:hypothetical protein